MGQNEDAAALRGLAGLATPMALRVAVTLELPDRLRGDGATIDELDLDVDPLALRLLLDHLVTVGVVERRGKGYRTTAYGENLCADAGNGLTTLLHLDTAAGRAELSFVELAHSVRTGEPGYPRRYGQGFWADLTEHRHLRDSFDRQMTHRFRLEAPQVLAGVDWSRFGTVVDVAGGRGGLLAAILAANPAVRGHLVELPPAAAEGGRTFEERGLADRATVTEGSFFDPLPPGDAYVLVDILHNWDDEHAGRVLRRCAEAANPGGRVLVIEPGPKGPTEFALTMFVFFGGRERRVEEYEALATPHGLVLDAVTDLTDQRALLEFRVA